MNHHNVVSHIGGEYIAHLVEGEGKDFGKELFSEKGFTLLIRSQEVSHITSLIAGGLIVAVFLHRFPKLLGASVHLFLHLKDAGYAYFFSRLGETRVSLQICEPPTVSGVVYF